MTTSNLDANDIAAERRDIETRAKADGTWLKAPNGKKSNLTPEQWVTVRTKAFKRWFGDWEKAARIEKLRSSENVVVSEDVNDGKYELDRESAEAYLLNELRGEYIIADTNEKVTITRKGAKKVTSHSADNIAHLKSIAVIPEMLHNAIFIDEAVEDVDKKNKKYDAYRYYMCGLRIGNEDYTVRITVGVKSGKYYYDHSLTSIEKGNLIEIAQGFTPNGGRTLPSYAESKDIRIIPLLQTNSSKIVDANGEPKVVYHGTPNEFYVFGEDISGKRSWTYEGTYFFTDNKANAGSYGGNVIPVFLNIKNPYEYNFEGRSFRNLNIGIAVVYARDNSILASGFKTKEAAEAWKENYIKENPDSAMAKDAAYLYVNEHAVLGQAGLSADDQTQKAKAEGYDGNIQYNIVDTAGGVYILNDDGIYVEDMSEEILKPRTNYIAFEPNQIKSATENVGTFDANNPDIRYSLREVNDRFNEQLATLTEENKDKVNLSLGMPSDILLAAGVVNKPMKLYGAKLWAKSKKHGYNVSDLRDLPMNVATPIAIFKGSTNGSHAVLTEIKVGENNVLAALSVGKGGEDIDFNIISSVYGKQSDNVVKWIEDGKLEYVDKEKEKEKEKEKALDYLHHSAPIAEALSNPIIVFRNPKQPKLFRNNQT